MQGLASRAGTEMEQYPKQLLKWIELWIQDCSVGLWQKVSIIVREAVLGKRGYLHFSVAGGRWKCRTMYTFGINIKRGNNTQRRALPKFLRA